MSQRGRKSGMLFQPHFRAFSLLVHTEQPLPTWLFLKKSRTSRRLPVQSRSENALIRPTGRCYQRVTVMLSTYTLGVPLEPSPSTWKSVSSAGAHPRANAEFTVELMFDWAPSSHTE